MLLLGWDWIGLLALATAALSVTIAKSTVGTPLRHAGYLISDAIGDLLSCYYCVSHWIAAVLVLWFMPRNQAWPDYLIAITVYSFAIVALAALISGLIIALKKHSQK